MASWHSGSNWNASVLHHLYHPKSTLQIQKLNFLSSRCYFLKHPRPLVHVRSSKIIIILCTESIARSQTSCQTHNQKNFWTLFMHTILPILMTSLAFHGCTTKIRYSSLSLLSQFWSFLIFFGHFRY